MTRSINRIRRKMMGDIKENGNSQSGVVAEIIIKYFSNGQLYVEGNNPSKIINFGMLELAKQVVSQPEFGKRPLVEVPKMRINP